MFDYIGIVIADGCEYEPMRDKGLALGGTLDKLGGMNCVRFTHGGVRITAIHCGIGKVNAASAAAFLLADGVELLVSTGYSGGIAGAPRGSTALATRFLEHDFDLTPLGYAPAVKPDQEYIYDAHKGVNDLILTLYPALAKGVMVSGDCFVCDDALRDRLRDNYGAVACDMESAAVASTGYKMGVGTVALRRISDDAGNDASGLYLDAAVYETSMTDMILNVIGNFKGAM
ncbi:MAG: 5'-methylthioadenosine/S-adenosylhomocysteine nucleosidase [Clostridia bacterium]|nr:5'-methylthioadenosine/S-adenosylhomocysteine nucleosidase [Clostridia bacterium]